MSEEINENDKVYNHYLELSKPTQEDLQRVFTEEELKELCLRHKCRVDMWRWNVVNDYRILFTESGRFQRWSARDRLRMLAKAVNKMKPSVLYDEKEIKKTRQEEWGLQLKENILSLNFWKRELLKDTHMLRSESDEIDREVQSLCEVNTESMNMAELLTQSESQEHRKETFYRDLDEEVQLQVDVHTESMNMDEIISESLLQEPPVTNVSTEIKIKKTDLLQTEKRKQQSFAKKQPRSKPTTHGEETKTEKLTPIEEENILLVDFEGESLFEDDSEDSVETVLLKESHLPTEVLHSEEVAPEIENIYGVNTMSMSIDSQISTQSQNLRRTGTQDILTPNYDNFINIIPLTSTQSQSPESEEIIVS